MSKPIKFIMMVSTLEPRKNHTKFLAAWDYLKNHGMPDLKLILVGERGWEENRILDAMAPWQQRGELFHIHRVPSGQLRILYNAAEAVVCPSVAEGFDLSGIEAMLCGGAVVASDITVHREVYGDACEYFKPYSTIDQAKAIENVIHPDRSSRREELVEAGLRHGPRYKRENVMPIWHEFFERIRGGAFNIALDKEYPHARHNPEPLPDFHEVANDLDEIAVGAGSEKVTLYE
jgi:glycosyltransferase involved in cell wall biosynthesis